MFELTNQNFDDDSYVRRCVGDETVSRFLELITFCYMDFVNSDTFQVELHADGEFMGHLYTKIHSKV